MLNIVHFANTVGVRGWRKICIELIDQMSSIQTKSNQLDKIDFSIDGIID